MARRFYRLLLSLYPRETRKQFGGEMESAFAALCREQGGDRRKLLGVVAHESADAVRAGLGGRRPGGPGRRFERFLADIRHAVRSLTSTPAFTAACLLIIALGIGSATAIFATLDGTLLRPLHSLPDAERLVAVYDYTRDRYGALSYPDYRDLSRNEAFAGLAAATLQPATLRTEDGPRRLDVQLVSASYFVVTGVDPMLGRGFVADEEEGFGGHPVVVLSHSLWQQRFGGSPSVVGDSIVLNGRQFEVVGVAPEGFQGHSIESTPDLWAPMVMIGAFSDIPLGDEILEFRGLMMFSLIGRLDERFGRPAAQASIAAQAVDIEAEAPGMFDRPREFLLTSADFGVFRPDNRGAVIRYTSLLMAVAGGLIAISAINLTGLWLVRTLARRQEVAIRTALGAPRRLLIQQLVTEGMVVSLLGGVIGIALATALRDAVQWLQLPGGLNPGVQMGSGAALFGMSLAVFMGFAFSASPALLTVGRDTGAGMRPGTRVTTHGYARSAIVVGQIALTIVALVGAGLFVRTVMALQSVDAGFDAESVVMATLDAESAGHDQESGAVLYERLQRDVLSFPGMDTATVASDVPLAAGSTLRDVLLLDGEVATQARHTLVGVDFFATFGIPLRSGRGIGTTDRAASRPVVVVNESFARLAWPGAEAIGQQIRLSPDEPASTVVGVAGDHRHVSLRQAPEPHVYWPLGQRVDLGKGPSTHVLAVRGGASTLSTVAAMRSAVAGIDPDIPLHGVVSMNDQVRRSIAEERQSAVLLTAFGGFALLLSAVGVFGALAHAVSQRRREIGVRCALGARADQVFASVVGDGVRLSAYGVAIGVVAAAFLSRLVASFLFAVSPLDPFTFVSIAALVLLVAVLASIVPARRAGSTDPAVTLRGES